MSEESNYLQKIYIQKSRIFLLPLTGLKWNNYFRPINTYTECKSLVSDEYPRGIKHIDKILIVTYLKSNILDSDEVVKKKLEIGISGLTRWSEHEQKELLSNRNFLFRHETEDEVAYTFDLSDYMDDWNRFLRGRYSLFEESSKVIVKSYKWAELNLQARNLLICYLYPYKEECLDAFVKELGEDSLESLLQVKELCAKPDLRLESYKCSIMNTENLNVVK